MDANKILEVLEAMHGQLIEGAVRAQDSVSTAQASRLEIAAADIRKFIILFGEMELKREAQKKIEGPVVPTPPPPAKQPGRK